MGTSQQKTGARREKIDLPGPPCDAASPLENADPQRSDVVIVLRPASGKMTVTRSVANARLPHFDPGPRRRDGAGVRGVRYFLSDCSVAGAIKGGD